MDVLVAPDTLTPGTSNIAQVRASAGGVARNITEVVARLGGAVALVSAVGTDTNGRAILSQLEVLGVDTSGILQSEEYPTSSYIAVLDPDTRDLVYGFADMRALDALQVPDTLACDVLVLDGNLSAESISKLAARTPGRHVWFEPISVAKSLRCIPALRSGHIGYLSPNRDELVAVTNAMGYPAPGSVEDRAAWLLANSRVTGLVVTLGSQGVLVATATALTPLAAVALDPIRIVNTNGAGDSLAGAAVYGLSIGMDLVDAVTLGLSTACLTLQSPAAVSPLISNGHSKL